ncbi:MAG: trigger factor [Desulfobulbaceae bacterium A2]|nr:MAG: trigger factor [Desulfobulbaceae bacterium A2]
MDIVVENVSELSRKVTITLPPEEARTELDAAYAKLQREVTLKGFRRGHVPLSVLRKTFSAKAEEEAGEKLVQATYFDAIEREKIDAVVHPEIKESTFSEDGGFVYVAMVDIRPQFELAAYKGLEIERPDTTVSEQEINEEIERLRREKAPLRNAGDRAATAGDVVVIDYQAFHNGKILHEVHNEDAVVELGADRLSRELEGKLIGMRKGEQALHEVSFPADGQHPLLAGRTIEFKVDVKEVRERVLPELDDEFAKDIDQKYTSLEELRAGLAEQMRQRKETAREGDLHDRIMERLLAANDFPIPQRLVQFEVQEMLSRLEENLRRQGLDFTAAGVDREALAEAQRPVAEKRVRGDFILKKIAEQEQITLQNEDIERGFKRIAAQYNMTVDEVRKYFRRREETLPLMHELLNEKVLALLKQEASMVDSAPAPAEAAA